MRTPLRRSPENACRARTLRLRTRLLPVFRASAIPAAAMTGTSRKVPQTSGTSTVARLTADGPLVSARVARIFRRITAGVSQRVPSIFNPPVPNRSARPGRPRAPDRRLGNGMAHLQKLDNAICSYAASRTGRISRVDRRNELSRRKPRGVSARFCKRARPISTEVDDENQNRCTLSDAERTCRAGNCRRLCG
jgi:hypothetical protein